MVNHFLFLAATEAAAEVEYSGALAPLYEILHKFGVEGPFLVGILLIVIVFIVGGYHNLFNFSKLASHHGFAMNKFCEELFSHHYDVLP